MAVQDLEGKRREKERESHTHFVFKEEMGYLKIGVDGEEGAQEGDERFEA